MTQYEVYELLKKSDKSLTKDEIAEATGVTANNIAQNLMRLRKRRELDVFCERGGKYRYTLRKG